jgi:hypothetical protein
MASLGGRYLFLLAIFLLLAVYYVGFSSVVASVSGGINYAGRLFTGQFASQPAAKKAA